MKSRDYLEKIINEEFSSREYIDIVGVEGIEQFIFETIIPEILKSLIYDDSYFGQPYFDYNDITKKKQRNCII